MRKHMIYASFFWQFFHLIARFSDLVNLNVTESNITSKCDFKSDEDENKHSLPPYEEIVKFRHTFLVYVVTFLAVLLH